MLIFAFLFPLVFAQRAEYLSVFKDFQVKCSAAFGECNSQVESQKFLDLLSKLDAPISTGTLTIESVVDVLNQAYESVKDDIEEYSDVFSKLNSGFSGTIPEQMAKYLETTGVQVDVIENDLAVSAPKNLPRVYGMSNEAGSCTAEDKDDEIEQKLKEQKLNIMKEVKQRNTELIKILNGQTLLAKRDFRDDVAEMIQWMPGPGKLKPVLFIILSSFLMGDVIEHPVHVAH